MSGTFFRPLIGDIPLIGGVQLYFLRQPEVEFDLGGAANVLEIPGLSGLLKSAVDDQVRWELWDLPRFLFLKNQNHDVTSEKGISKHYLQFSRFQLSQHMVLPNKISVVLTDKVSVEALRMPRPAGVVAVKVQEGRDLKDTDPLTRYWIHQQNC